MIRPAEARDAAAIAEIWNPIIRDTAITFNSEPKTEADIVALIEGKAQAGHAFFVAGEDEICGFALYGQFRAGAGYARSMEHTIVLAPAARGAGLGRALMAAVEEHARNRGAHVLMAGISGENEGGVAFHAGIGFRKVATVPEVGWKFGRAMDLVLMQKFL